MTILVAAVLLISLLGGNILKKSIKFLQASLIPTSVLAGGLLIVVAGVYKLITGDVMFDTEFFGGNGTAKLELITYRMLMTDGKYSLSNFMAKGTSSHNYGIALDLTLEKIKDGTIAESKDLRKIGKLVRSDDDEAVRVLNDYVNGECDIEEVEDIVANTDKLSNAIKQSTKFHQFLTNADRI